MNADRRKRIQKVLETLPTIGGIVEEAMEIIEEISQGEREEQLRAFDAVVRGLDLDGLDLRGANLSEADLRGY